MSTLRAATIADLAGTGPATLTGQTAAKAWMNLNGTGTIAIRASANTSSATDNGTGDYTQNLSSALVDANYAFLSQCKENTSGNQRGDRISTTYTAAHTSSAFRVTTVTSAYAVSDVEFVFTALVR